MNKFQRVKKIVCEDCGAPFFGIYGHYCDKCRKKRRQKKKMAYKICPVCKTRRHMFAEQLICRGCTFAMLKQQDKGPRGIEEVEKIRNARKTGGPLHKIDTCPNFDAASITCATCEPGSFKFKDCGKAILSIALVLLAGLAQGYTIKATGYVRAVIVAPVSVPETKADVSQVEYVQTVVYTSQGPTSQVVF